MAFAAWAASARVERVALAPEALSPALGVVLCADGLGMDRARSAIDVEPEAGVALCDVWRSADRIAFAAEDWAPPDRTPWAAWVVAARVKPEAELRPAVGSAA